MAFAAAHNLKVAHAVAGTLCGRVDATTSAIVLDLVNCPATSLRRRDGCTSR